MIENKFESNQAEDHMPERLVAGSLWQCKNTYLVNAYDPGRNTYTLVFTFVSLNNGANPQQTVQFTADPNTFHLRVNPIDNASMSQRPGEWKWSAVITNTDTGDSVVAAEGYSLVEDTSDVPQVYQILLAIRANIAKAATKEQMEYSVAGRSLKSRGYDELLVLQGQYERRWAAEKDRARREQGREGRRTTRWRLRL